MDDLAAIIRLTHAYALANDRFEIDALVALFAPDATIDFTAFGMRRYEGRDEIRRYFEKERSVLSHVMHLTSNHVIDVDGETAAGTVYFVATAVTRQGNENVARGYYDDAYVRLDGDWRFAARTMVPLIPYAPVWEERAAPAATD